MAAFKSKDKVYGVYIDSLLTKKVILSITEIGKNIKENLQRKLADSMEGKCIEEGFIRPGSIRIESYSCGLVNTENIEFQTVFTCKVCHPVEGMLIECTSKTITKAGIHAQVLDRDIVPVTVFVARDHHNMDRYFQSIQENTKILVKVIGIRYELNDPYICVLAKLLKDEVETAAAPQKIRIKKQPINIGGDVLDTASEEE
jgi:DNA-directed RNA polymerase subunit E'/Rpb7